MISRARTSNAHLHRRAANSRMISQSQQQSNAAAAAAAGGGGGGGINGAAAAEGEAQQQRTLPIIIKADVQGSAEALKDAVAHMATEHVRVQVGGLAPKRLRLGWFYLRRRQLRIDAGQQGVQRCLLMQLAQESSVETAGPANPSPPAFHAGGARGSWPCVALRCPAGGAPGRQGAGLQRAPRWR